MNRRNYKKLHSDFKNKPEKPECFGEFYETIMENKQCKTCLVKEKCSNNKKVYCKDCKYYSFSSSSWGDICKAYSTIYEKIEDNWFSERTTTQSEYFTYASSANKNNNCYYYKSKKEADTIKFWDFLLLLFGLSEEYENKELLDA